VASVNSVPTLRKRRCGPSCSARLINRCCVPAQLLLVRRQDLTSPENPTRLQAEIRRRFEAAGAVNAG
jgi:hypothetical protein